MSNPPLLPREKLQTLGSSTLSDAELLMIFIGSGQRGRSAESIAKGLLVEFGSLRNLVHTHLDRLLQSPGVGLATAVQIKAIHEVLQRILLNDTLHRNVIESPDEVRRLLINQLSGEQREQFMALYLDHRHRLMSIECVSEGGIASAQVYPREIIRRALDLNASAMIVAHNHPSGEASPSQADIRLTHRLKQQLETVEVRLLDHLVIGSGEVYSLAEHGEMGG